jgi:hypothetical protein
VFTSGEEGGVIVQPKVQAEQHSFYVSDDEKSIVIQVGEVWSRDGLVQGWFVQGGFVRV